MKSRLIVGIFFIIGSMFFLVKTYAVHKDVIAGVKWPYVEGKIIESKLPPSMFPGDDEANYNPDIKYTYIVSDRKFTSNVIMFGGVIDGKHSEMYKYLERYPKGSIVKVYYNPTKPEEAVLEPGENDISFYFVISVFLAACGILLVVNYFTGFGEGFIAFFERSGGYEAN